MKWVLIIVAGIGVLVGLMALIGAMLPKAHHASVQVGLRTPAPDVFKLVEDFAGWPSWNKSVTSVVRVEDQNGHPVWKVKDENGVIPSEVVESMGPSEVTAGRIVTRIADPKLPYGGTWTWLFTPAGESCTVSITEEGEVYNPLFRFMARFFFGYTATIEKYLASLETKFGGSS